MIRPEIWHPADGLTLEPNALAAAKEQIKCQALTAGPGAGKTEMLAQRADFLLRTGLCRYPKRILAISFKVDASRNLKERVRQRCGSSLSSRFDSYTFHAFAKRIIDRFRPVLTGRDSLDADYTIGEQRVTRRQITFLDIIPLAVQILENSLIARNAVRQTYCDVFLDEFQDCTKNQYELIKLAFQKTNTRLTAVGDTKQKIMGWAGALEGIFVTFANDFSAIPLNLYRNFRSKSKLLRMQNEIIKVLDAGSVMPDELIEGNDGIVEIHSFSNSQQEAESLAAQIVHWVDVEKVPHSEIAILVSKQSEQYTELLMEELEMQGIPYRNEQQLQDISAEPATRLIVDYLLVLFGDREPNAYSRLMSQLADPIIDEQNQSKQRNEWHHFIKVERKKVVGVELSCENFDAWWAHSITFLNEFGMDRLASLSADYESRARLEEILKGTQKRLCELIATEPDVIKALTLLTDDHAVRIMTIHKSKGLEFDSVVILAIENQTFWGKIDEERCAFFVGVSRAKKRLVLTYVNERPRPTGFGGRWTVARTPHNEFISYAEQFR
ncbi:MAG: ATP-dependent helicase [Proteobacteria bacterium]|nr:ATP-dependent helicase [Desulfobulbaceae bacterium]MBU4151594.1 ATP-dependent helicase [Pseudomonadota bacterium]